MANEPDSVRSAARALRGAIPTRRHAEMLFDMLLDHLGDSAWIESVEGEATRTLFRRTSPDSTEIIPWPLVAIVRGGREGPGPIPTGIPGVYDEPEPRPGPTPKLRGLGAGSLDIHDGPHRLTVAYGGDGRWFETSMSRKAGELGRIVDELAAGGGAPAERVAEMLAGLDIGQHGPARTNTPVALPHGVRSLWTRALHAMREALFRDRVPADAAWLCADGWTGAALAWGTTRTEAIERWREELARVRPFPSKPEPIPDDVETKLEHFVTETSFGFYGTIRGAKSDTPWVEPTLENSPHAVVELAAPPASPAPLGTWIRLLGAHGTTVPAALRWEPEGFTLVGDGVGPIDVDALERRIAEADADADLWPKPPGDVPHETPNYDTRLRIYPLVDESGAPVDPRVTSESRSFGIKAAGLDPERLRGCAARSRPM